MEHRESRPPERRRRRRCILLSVVGLLLLLIIVTVVLGLSLRQNTDKLNPTFIARCQEFKGYDCEKMWDVFEQAYVGRDPCDVPMEAYDPFIAAAPLKPACNRMMFWRLSAGVCAGWSHLCGKEGSSETFTTGCPGWTDCFADVACGDVTAMLNGSIVTPFHPASIFASIEVKRFDFPRVKSLNVVLVTQNKTVTNCTNASLKDLQKELNQGITYNCEEVTESRTAAPIQRKPCGACW
ncbi:hypothetical protein KUCAC02_017246 [Chaenocephalus aceratus]|uniref:Uncharacterized protein n=1 Tax=Chaenocephalus aceratus TaxID=36190 RepID=A0ACB9W0N0_CHAAC|nr:hypothetical protein KUCAC02_017246 [Chaenocephalus aceratus]